MSDAAGGTDAVVVTRARNLTDSAGGTDALTSARMVSSFVSDSAGGTDILAAALAAPRSLTDSAGGADVLNGGGTRMLTDIAGGTDAVTRTSVIISPLSPYRYPLTVTGASSERELGSSSSQRTATTVGGSDRTAIPVS